MANIQSDSPEPSSNESPLLAQLTTLLKLCIHHPVQFGLCLFLLGGIWVVPKVLPTDSNAPGTLAQPQVARADYERLQLGMSLTDAQAALGRAIEVSRDEQTATYKWTNADGSEILAVFKSNRMTSKKQSGLK